MAHQFCVNINSAVIIPPMVVASICMKWLRASSQSGDRFTFEFCSHFKNWGRSRISEFGSRCGHLPLYKQNEAESFVIDSAP